MYVVWLPMYKVYILVPDWKCWPAPRVWVNVCCCEWWDTYLWWIYDRPRFFIGLTFACTILCLWDMLLLTLVHTPVCRCTVSIRMLLCAESPTTANYADRMIDSLQKEVQDMFNGLYSKFINKLSGLHLFAFLLC